MAGIKVFLSYAHEDEALLKELAQHLGALRHEGIIKDWWDRKLLPGSDWNEEILQELEEADLILLLVSPSFLNSPFCYKEEMRRAVARHHTGTARVIPIALRPCHWAPAPFAKLQGLPTDMVPVDSWPTKRKRNAVWAKVAKAIHQAVEAHSAVLQGSISAGEHNVQRDGNLEKGLHRLRLSALIDPWRQKISFLFKFGVITIAVSSLVLMGMSWHRPLRNVFSLEAIQMIILNQPPAVSLPTQSLKYFGDRVNNEIGRKFDEELSKRFEIDTGIKVKVDNPGHKEPMGGFVSDIEHDERLDMLKQHFENKKDPYDVVMIDIVWVGELADHLIDLTEYFEDVKDHHRPEIIKNNTIDGKLVAMPWFLDFGLLYYRTDLMSDPKQEPPKTWEDLEKRASEIQKKFRAANHSEFIGFAWQGKKYEGLSVNALEWIGSHGGLDENGQIKDKKAVVKSLDRARAWVQEGKNQISKGVVDATEDVSLERFIQGNAAFLRTWPNAYSKIKQHGNVQFGVAPLPSIEGQKSVSMIGGWQLAIPKYSRNPQAAARFIRYLVSKEVQVWRALEGTYVPTITAIIYNEANKYFRVHEAMPFLRLLTDHDLKKIARPSSHLGKDYSNTSKCFYMTVYKVIQSPDSKIDSEVSNMQKDPNCEKLFNFNSH